MDITKLLGSTAVMVSPANAEGNERTVFGFIDLDSLVIASKFAVVVTGISSILSLLLCKLRCPFKNRFSFHKILSMLFSITLFEFLQLDFKLIKDPTKFSSNLVDRRSIPRVRFSLANMTPSNGELCYESLHSACVLVNCF